LGHLARKIVLEMNYSVSGGTLNPFNNNNNNNVMTISKAP